MRPKLSAWVTRTRWIALLVAAALALSLLGLDRYAAMTHRPDANSRSIVIYTTAWCPYCARLRQGLAASGISYVEHDVEKSLQGQLGFWALRARGVPVSVIGPEIVYGYDVPRLSASLNLLGYELRPIAAAASDAKMQSSVP